MNLTKYSNKIWHWYRGTAYSSACALDRVFLRENGYTPKPVRVSECGKNWYYEV